MRDSSTSPFLTNHHALSGTTKHENDISMLTRD